MDVNRTRFHLVREREEWETLQEPGGGWSRVEWDCRREALTLYRKVFHFEVPSSSGVRARSAASRRAAAVDRYGTIYWIGPDRTRVFRQRPGPRESELYWNAAAGRGEAGEAVGAVDRKSGFAPVQPPEPPEVRLRGLTVTGHHYLVVGNPPGHELLVVDLHAGGPALHLRWPADVAFGPWDLDPAPDDGFWILDRAGPSPRYWLVDRTFGVVPPRRWPGAFPPPSRRDVAPGDRQGAFRPRSGRRPPAPPLEFPPPIPLAGVSDPVSLAGLPGGGILVLDTPAGGGPSTVSRHEGSDRVWDYTLDEVVPLADEEKPADVRGFDLAWVPDADAPEERGALVVLDEDGNQAFRLPVDWDASPVVETPREYLPLRRYGGAELVVRDGAVLYDFRDRWIELRSVSRPRYETDATLVTSEAMDGREEGCRWHRVVLDACIPPGTSVEVEVRVADDEDALEFASWRRQPKPYRRAEGAELPYHGRFDRHAEDWHSFETLLQEVTGRHLQLRLRIQGTGRATPALRAVRVHYPRFSYLDRYLPRIYREDPESASFLDRFLANFEGQLTTWEGRIVEAHRFFDPWATPAAALAFESDAEPREALDWLAGWLGVVMDPLWDERRRRLFLAHAADLYRWRGTPRGIEIAVRLYLEEEPTEALFEADAPGSSPIRIVELFRTRRTGFPGGRGPEEADVLLPLTRELVEGGAHRFVLLVPDDLDAERIGVVRRIVELEKPAHTSFHLQFFWALFRAGIARLGLDTRLGPGPRYRPAVLGSADLGEEGHLTAGHPFDVEERVVLERDRYGREPPL